MGFAVHGAYLRPQCALLDRVLSSGTAHKGCRVLASEAPSGHAAHVLVPLPDPGSFPFLLHWLYWGDVGAFEHALASGSADWNGVVANADFLDADIRTKRTVAHWWQRWVRSGLHGARESREGDSDGVAEDSEDEEDAYDEDSPALSHDAQATEQVARLLDQL